MRTIAFVTQKGGSGKSTLASSLAVTAMEAGERVFIIDLDPQASLIKWSKMRGEADVPVEAVAPAKLATALATLAKNGVTLCIIDTAGAESATATSAMKAADLCIIPSRPNVFDLWASEQTRKSLREMNKQFVFLLNQCPPAQQSARVDEGVKALEAMPSGAEPGSAAVPLKRSDLLSQCDLMLRQLGWDAARGRQLLETQFGRSSRQQLSDSQLLEFNMVLEGELISSTQILEPDRGCAAPTGWNPGLNAVDSGSPA
ncbi:MAG: ParA family protein [Betaproteobacteria bacterium]|nr:ParA family protein [Betaproteobacteria bacterium]